MSARTRRPMPKAIRLAAVLAASTCLSPVLVPQGAAAQSIDYDRHASGVLAVMGAHVVERPTADQGEDLGILESVLRERQSKRQFALTRGIKPLTRRDAALAGLDRNLTLAIGRGDPQVAAEALREAEAVFDPVFDLSVGYTRSDTYTREKVGFVNEQFFLVTGTADEPIFDDPLADTGTSQRRLNLCSISAEFCNTDDPVVRAIEYYIEVSPEDNIEEAITASASRSGNFGHPDQTVEFSLGVTQQLPWGGELTLTDETVVRKIYYRRNDFWGDGAFTTDITGTLDMPVPFARGFGADSANQTSIRLAEVVRERTDWSLKSLINDTLRDVDVAYLELIRRLQFLENTVENRRLIGRLRARMNRLFDAGEATRYQKAQLDSEFTKADIRVERALQDYINASIDLANLMGDPDVRQGDVIYLPYAYRIDPRDDHRFTVGTALETARYNRPEFFIADLDRKAADINLRFAQNETRPDVDVSASVFLNQNNQVYGYEHPLHSHNRIIRPDSINQSYTLSYTYPWRNRSLESAAVRAQLSVDDSRLGVRATTTEVRQEIAQQLANLQAATARERVNEDRVRSRQRAYESLVRQQEVGIVSEDELINASRLLLDAQLALTGSTIDREQARVQLQFAQGTIAADLPMQTAQTRFETNRLNRLASAGMTPYFAKADRGG